MFLRKPLRSLHRSFLGALCLALWTLTSGCVTPASQASQPGTFGVLVMAHGGSADWNQAVRNAIQPLNDTYPTEVAFGMADASSIQEGVRALESRGVHRIAVIRLFVSGESWRDRTAQILGLQPGAPSPPSPDDPQSSHDHSDHEMAFWRIASASSFVMAQDGLMDAPQMGTVLAARAVALSQHPETEDVLILAHGPEDDAENERWLSKLQARAQAVKDLRPFRRVQVETLREDWPDKRAAAEARVRSFVERASTEHGTAIVIPFRVEGFGPYARVLKGLTYVADGKGLLPHPEVSRWIKQQAEALK